MVGEGIEEIHPTGGLLVTGWGIGDDDLNVPDDLEESNSNWCRTKIPIDTSNLNLQCDGKKCRLSPYFRLPVDRSTTVGEVVPEDQVPIDVKEAVDARAESLWEEPARGCDGTFLSPQGGHDSVCFDTPGPSSDTVYCRRTSDERWIAYQWYRFVDQPELNQVRMTRRLIADHTRMLSNAGISSSLNLRRFLLRYQKTNKWKLNVTCSNVLSVYIECKDERQCLVGSSLLVICLLPELKLIKVLLFNRLKGSKSDMFQSLFIPDSVKCRPTVTSLKVFILLSLIHYLLTITAKAKGKWTPTDTLTYVWPHL